MNQGVQELSPETARRIHIWQMAIFGLLLAALALSNTYTTIADYAVVGDQKLPFWAPFTWECSSCLVLWILVFAVAWWLRLFPLSLADWVRNLPAHVLATLPFSLVHVGVMVALRKLVYRILGSYYEFGSWWTHWFYEYRKDAFAYTLIVAGLSGLRIYGLWLDSRNASSSANSETPLERIVVRKLNREFILNAADIDRIEADGNCVKLHVRGSIYPMRQSLVALEKKLDHKRFARVHRAHIVNIDRIREIQPWDHGDYRILLMDGSFVNFSRRYRGRLQQLLQ